MSVQQLTDAAYNGNVNEVTRLLNNGVDINAFNPSGNTVLMRASWNGREAVVRLLLSRGANVNLARSDGSTALMDACQFGHVSVAELLLRSGADHTLKDTDGKTALEYCRDSAKRAQLQAVIDSRVVSPAPSAPRPPPSTASVPAPTPAPTPAPASGPPTPPPMTVSHATTMEQLRTQLASVTSERDSLQRQLADRTRELNTQLHTRTTERDAALAEKSQVIAQRDSFQTQLTQRTREKETLNAQLVDRDSQLAQRTTERDTARSQLSVRTTERDQMSTQLADRTRERDGAVADRTRLNAERTQLAAQRDALQAQLAERDGLIEQLMAAGAEGGGTASGSAANSCAFERYRPHKFVPSLVPCCRHPGTHDVSEDSALFRTCRSLCNVGGSWIPALGPVAGFRLVAVQAVVHEEADYIGYENKLRRITQQRQNGGDYFNSNTGSMNASQLLVLSALREQFLERAPGTVSKGANSFYCYHGPRAEHVTSICTTGMVATRAMDAGFFGSGCYTTLNMEYAARYARGDFDADGGPRLALGSRYPVIMFAATTGMAYPVTPDDYGHNTDSAAPRGTSDFFGKPLKPGYDSHVICVSQASNWQAVERDRCQYVEVVIDQQEQLLPVAVLWFEDLSGF